MNVPTAFSHFFTFAAFAIAAELQGVDSFSVTQAITSLSILNILMDPLGLLIYVIPQGYAALGCFQRIQDFLSTDSWEDQRQPAAEARSSLECPGVPEAKIGDIPLTTETISKYKSSRIVVKDAVFGWKDSPVVNDVNLHISEGMKLTLILGPVGCGKSTLLKGLLGETSILSGSVWVRTKQISFCDHNPWLTSGTIRDNIVGHSEFEKGFYDAVIHACTLDIDLENMPDGDCTAVGSKGVTLSGGQKQRIVSTHISSSQVQAYAAIGYCPSSLCTQRNCHLRRRSHWA